MPYHPALHHRRSIRIPGYDYSSAGYYFVTLCVQLKRCLFGRVIDDHVELSPAGKMVDDVWRNLPSVYPGVEQDYYEVMPNHLHGILVLTGEPVADRGGRPLTLGRVLQGFKNWTITQYIKGVRTEGWPRFPGKLWQRDYYEHVVRNEKELTAIRRYIEDNPRAWAEDDYHPGRLNRFGGVK